jgi:hypothetical protein
LSSKTCNLCYILKVRDQVSHLYKTNGKTDVLYISISSSNKAGTVMLKSINSDSTVSTLFGVGGGRFMYEFQIGKTLQNNLPKAGNNNLPNFHELSSP